MLWNVLFNVNVLFMVDISRRTCERNTVETTRDTEKHLPDHRKHNYQLVDETKKQPNKIFIDK